MSEVLPVEKWGQWSYVTDEMLADGMFVEAALVAAAERSCTAAGYKPIDGTGEVTIVDPRNGWFPDEHPEGCQIAYVTLRAVKA